MYKDAWDSEVSVVNKFIQYRMRSLALDVVSEMKVKGKRLYINHFKENVSQPKMCIICKNHEDAMDIYNYIHDQFADEDIEYDDVLPVEDEDDLTTSFWSWFGCNRS
jgi:hypothetical protein